MLIRFVSSPFVATDKHKQHKISNQDKNITLIISFISANIHCQSHADWFDIQIGILWDKHRDGSVWLAAATRSSKCTVRE